MGHLSKFFFNFFPKDVISQAFPKAQGLLAKQKGASVSQPQDHYLLQEAGKEPAGVGLALCP